MAINYAPRIVTDGLVLCLDAANPKSYPGSGTTWFDLSKDGNHGTLINGVDFTSNNQGAMEFDGVDDFIRIEHTEKLSNEIFSQTLFSTLETWVNMSEFRNWTCMINHAFGGSYSNTTGPGLWSNTGGYQFVVGTGVSGNPSGGSQVLSFSANTNEWYHITGTINGTDMRMYVNGELHQSATTSINPVQSHTSPIVIGRRSVTTTPVMIGNIGLVKAYNRPLTPEEIQQNFNATRGRYGIQ